MSFESINSFKDSGDVRGHLHSDAQTNSYHVYQIEKVPSNHGANCIPLVVPNETTNVPLITASIPQLTCASNTQFAEIKPTIGDIAPESPFTEQNINHTITNTTNNTINTKNLPLMTTLQEEDEENTNM